MRKNTVSPAAGVPAMVFGNAIARPVAETRIQSIETPYWGSADKRLRWASAMAYCQWSMTELESGEAWAELKAEILRQRVAKETESLKTILSNTAK